MQKVAHTVAESGVLCVCVCVCVRGVVRCLCTGCVGVGDARRAARAEARGRALRDDDRHDAALPAAALQLLRGAPPSKSSDSPSTQPANAQFTGHTDNSQSDPSLSSRDAYSVVADGRIDTLDMPDA